VIADASFMLLLLLLVILRRSALSLGLSSSGLTSTCRNSCTSKWTRVITCLPSIQLLRIYTVAAYIYCAPADAQACMACSNMSGMWPIRRLGKAYSDALGKLRMPLAESWYLVGVPDWSGAVPAGCIALVLNGRPVFGGVSGYFMICLRSAVNMGPHTFHISSCGWEAGHAYARS
jgi:hypothetical protein